ncbi:acetate--CoA ligase family protein [Streptosporangium soli]
MKSLLREAGIPVPTGVVITTGDPDFSPADDLRRPLVVKAYGPDLVHKSDVGAVRLNVTDPAAAAGDMLAALLARGIAPDGFLIEEQAPAGTELIVGLLDDPGFGPILLTGLGGIWTEVLRDTAIRLCPVSPDDVRAMLAELRAAPLLHGHRGAPPADLGSLERLLLAVGGPGGLWTTLDLGEFELNPVIAGPAGCVAVDARLLPAAAPRRLARATATADFTRLFEPRRVAVVGASTTRPGFGNMFLDFYRATGVPVTAVHPSAREIGGVPCVPSLAAAGADYALVAVPADRCAEVVRQAGRTGFVQVMSGGFGETGRADLEDGLVAAAREAGVRLLGPNCMGVYSPRGGQTFVGGGPGPAGGTALISQSGGLAGEVIKVGERRGLAFSRVVTVGNAADVGPAELLRWLSADPHTTAVGMYLEDPRDGRALFEALTAIRGELPVVLLTGGRTRQGRRAAASHTGGLAGDARVWPALAEQTRATLVTSQDDLIGVLLALQSHRARLTTTGDGVLVVGPSGGASVLAADACDTAGLVLAPLPDGVAGLNPMEIPVGPRASPELVRDTITAIAGRRPYADVIAHVNVQSFFTYGDSAEPLLAYARCLAEVPGLLPGARITLVTRNAGFAPAGVEDAVRAVAADAAIPVFRSVEAAAVAVAAVRRFALDRRS